MHNQSILVSIHQAVNKIIWKKPILKKKGTDICIAMFNQFLYDNDAFSEMKQFAQNYFTKVTGSKAYYFVKDILVQNDVLETDNYYEYTEKGKNGRAKGYRFNSKFFVESNYSSTSQTFTYSTTNFSSTNSTIPLYCPNEDTCYCNISDDTFSLNSYVKALLERLTFTDYVDARIKNLAEIQARKIILNENITTQFFDLNLNKRKPRFSLQTALLLAKEKGKDLIHYKNRFYIDDAANFIKNKTLQLNISYCHSVFNIKNKIFYCGRNDTNNRLDSNLTGLKKELFEHLLFDGEKLEELDIANAQFAIGAHLNTTIDANFIDNARGGSLYSYTAKALNLSTPTGKDEEYYKAGKSLMFRVAFDKINPGYEFEQVRKLFPEYMKWADGYKKQHGYKSFSNLLQKKEAEIMIDGLLMTLIRKGYDVFTIHDALRVKQSQVAEIKVLVNEYFDSIGFKCHVR